MKRVEKRMCRRLRARYEYADDDYLYVRLSDLSGEQIKVRYRVNGCNDEFTDNIPLFWSGASINLLDVVIDEDDVYTPSFMVLEPDYLVDISSLAECYRDYGSHPVNYFMSRLQPVENARPLLIGNIANLFLDEWIYSEKEVPDYVSTMKKAFRQYSIELAACDDLQDPVKEREFFADCKMHFEHIRETVLHTFPMESYGLNKEDAVLEPSYICEA